MSAALVGQQRAKTLKGAGWNPVGIAAIGMGLLALALWWLTEIPPGSSVWGTPGAILGIVAIAVSVAAYVLYRVRPGRFESYTAKMGFAVQCVLLGAITTYVARHQGSDWIVAERCADNLRRVGTSFRIVVAARQPPPNTLAGLLGKGSGRKERLLCPNVNPHNEDGCDYVYLAGRRGRKGVKPYHVVAYELPANHPRGANVLVANGQVQTMSEDELRAAVELTLADVRGLRQVGGPAPIEVQQDSVAPTPQGAADLAKLWVQTPRARPTPRRRATPVRRRARPVARVVPTPAAPTPTPTPTPQPTRKPTTRPLAPAVAKQLGDVPDAVAAMSDLSDHVRRLPPQDPAAAESQAASVVRRIDKSGIRKYQTAIRDVQKQVSPELRDMVDLALQVSKKIPTCAGQARKAKGAAEDCAQADIHNHQACQMLLSKAAKNSSLAATESQLAAVATRRRLRAEMRKHLKKAKKARAAAAQDRSKAQSLKAGLPAKKRELARAMAEAVDVYNEHVDELHALLKRARYLFGIPEKEPTPEPTKAPAPQRRPAGRQPWQRRQPAR